MTRRGITELAQGVVKQRHNSLRGSYRRVAVFAAGLFLTAGPFGQLVVDRRNPAEPGRAAHLAASNAAHRSAGEPCLDRHPGVRLPSEEYTVDIGVRPKRTQLGQELMEPAGVRPDFGPDDRPRTTSPPRSGESLQHPTTGLALGKVDQLGFAVG